MKTDIFIPIYVGDYIKDTQDLSLLEHGVYFKLIINYWNNQGALTNDIERLKRLCNAISNAEADALAYILHKFFEEKNNTFYHKRIEKELKLANDKRKQSKDRAKKAANARWNATSNAQAMLEECPSPTPSPLKKNNKKESSVKLDDLSVEHLANFIEQESLDEKKVEKAIPEFIDYWKSTGKQRKDWLATFRNYARNDKFGGITRFKKNNRRAI